MFTHQNQIFRKAISAPMECCAPIFLQALENDQFLVAQPHLGRGPRLLLFLKGGQKLA